MINMLVRRGLAFIVDAILLVLIFFGNFTVIMASVPTGVENTANLSSLFIMIVLQLFYVGIYFIYIPMQWPGQTIGKKLLKIKEVTQSGKELTAKQYFQRDFLCKFLLSSMTSGFIILFNAILLTYQCIRKQELRTFHDILVKTKVISVK